jgi:hypothetical protein
MNVFQLIQTVLDEIYKRLAGDDDTKDKNIGGQMVALREAYRKLAKTGVPNNYADPVTRFAYIYVYVTSHANVVYQLITNCLHSGCSALAELFDREQVNITCIGGGPGSDFLGILKYMINNGKQSSLKVNLFDREPAWSESWSDVDDKLKMPISNRFMLFDVTKPETWNQYDKFLSADLFTMIYFMSEINSLRDQAEPFFSHLFKRANPGALILYVDNNSPEFYPWFDSLAKEHNWKVLMSAQETLGMEDLTEEKRALEPFYSKFQDPKLKANIAYRICQKQ